MFRTLLGILFLVLYVIFVGLPVIAVAALTNSSDFLYNAGTLCIRATLAIIGVRVKSEGVENVPGSVCIFAANHVSALDPPAALLGIPRRISFLAKKEVFKFPVVATAMRLARIVPVDRSDREAAIGSMDRAREVMKLGISFVVFPEGTRSPDGRLRAFKKGTFVLAIQAGVPVVPVAVLGSRALMPKGKLAVRPGEIILRFGKPIDGAAYTMEHRDELMVRVHASVAGNLPEEMRPLAKQK
ncbi:MAG TPA: lysophospholipid acyltransferase family protein [Candidatus Acidoferrales bacterium]|nr:lysophospholipid acyltransferase family protein [Candidatus Acidoferrales bacterium]